MGVGSGDLFGLFDIEYFGIANIEAINAPRDPKSTFSKQTPHRFVRLIRGGPKLSGCRTDSFRVRHEMLSNSSSPVARTHNNLFDKVSTEETAADDRVPENVTESIGHTPGEPPANVECR